MKRFYVLIMVGILATTILFAQEDEPLQKIYGLFQEGKFQEAMTLVDQQIQKKGETEDLLQAKFFCLKALDRNDEALGVALKRESIAQKKSPWLCMDIVEIYVSKQDEEKAIAWLNKAADLGYNGYMDFETAEYDFLREEPRFTQLIDKIKEKVGIGKQAKDFTVELTAGGSFQMSAQKGKVILVDFWATWCGPCRAEMPTVKEVYAEYKDQGFEILGISLDYEREKLDGYVNEEGLGWHISFSGKGWNDDLVAAYGVNSIPSFWLVDKKGVLRYFGLRGESLGDAVAELLKE